MRSDRNKSAFPDFMNLTRVHIFITALSRNVQELKKKVNRSNFSERVRNTKPNKFYLSTRSAFNGENA